MSKYLGKGAVRFELPITKSKSNNLKAQMEKRHQAKTNKQALKATRDTQYNTVGRYESSIGGKKWEGK
jgi:hypothetical protein